MSGPILGMRAFFTQILNSFAYQSPVYIAWLVGIVLAVVRWRRHPRASLLAVIGLCLLLVNSAFGAILNAALPGALRVFRTNYTAITGTLRVIQVIQSVVSAAGFGVLLAAIFGGRAAPLAIEKEI